MERERTLKSEVWRYFTKNDNLTATCNICNQDYSYRTSISNLRKHYMQIHKPGQSSYATEISNSETSDGEQENSLTKGKVPTWKYFDVLDSDKFEANCKLCGNNVPYDTVSDLKRHIITEHGEKPKDSEDEEDEIQLSESAVKKSSRKVSVVWQYYKIVDSETRSAVCMFCQKTISYAATVSNLKKHLIRKHPQAKLRNNDNINKLVISANGQLYEVESSSHKAEVDDEEKDPIHMDTVYLDDFENSLDELPKTDRRSSTPKKKPFSLKRNFQPKIQKEQFELEQKNRNRNRDSSSEDEVPNKKRYISTKRNMERLDYFGQYIISLLKELPKSVSDQLQSEMIKQIITTKVALETQAMTNYEIKINENHLNQSNQIVTEPVTVTISEAKEEIGNSNVVMVPESTENNDTN